MDKAAASSIERNDEAGKSRLPAEARRARLKTWRAVKDRFSTVGVTAGGLGVVFALALIFFYLFYEVSPLLRSASLTPVSSFALADKAGTDVRRFTLERYNELGAVFTGDGRVRFIEARDGRLRREAALPLPPGTEAVSFAAADPAGGVFAYGLSYGTARGAKTDSLLLYPYDRRNNEPTIDYPLGETPLEIDARGGTLRVLGVQNTGQGIVAAAATGDGRLLLARFSASTNLFTGETTVRREERELAAPSAPVERILLDRTGRNLFVADAAGDVHYYDIGRPEGRLMQSVRAVAAGASVTAMEFLTGSVSVIVGGSDGSLSQWFLVRDEENIERLTRIRDFRRHSAAITAIAPEYNRKGFVAADAAGGIGVHYATSARTLLLRQVGEQGVRHLGLSPINTALLVLDDAGRVHSFALDNPHPQVSFSSLWGKVWYEGRSAPNYIWQSSSASDEFESKFSMVPLSVGTLKAAFFAMLFAVPLAIMGAIYTAYFMTKVLRGLVKPTIEIMEALPTVILGFLAGLWLAPFIEKNLPSVFAILFFTPLAMLASSLLWSKLPVAMRSRLGGGWEGALLVPAVLLVGWLSVTLSPQVEVWFFDGSMRQWLTDVGITYDQRNALVVGIAMGFAVIPTIFSIAEDAIFNVPKHLTQGSMALGATPWQTVMGVVLPTASPGIFSAVMIGFGRAVGETMIVLMATGNSPITNFNIFEGMRTLSANIAVELPETAVGSTHYRILFLAALILFALTFVVNTIAEVVRQRLRKRYSSL